MNLGVDRAANGVDGGAQGVPSDARPQYDIRPIASPLGGVLSLPGDEFKGIAPLHPVRAPETRPGFGAQEVEALSRDRVSVGPDGYRAASFSGFEALDWT